MTYTVEQYQKELDKRLRQVSLGNKLYAGCFGNFLSDYTNRIFISGRDGNLQQIGTYTSEEYKKQKREKGIPSNKVNFRFTERLWFDLRNGLERRGESWVIGTKNTNNSDKTDWLEDRYGERVFASDKRSRERLQKCIDKQATKIMQGDT